MPTQRLQKAIAQAGIASRRAAEECIRGGRVTINGVVVTELGTTADPETQDIRVDGQRVRPAKKHVYLLLNKPEGYVTTRSDPEKRRTVMELLPPRFGHLFPVGRLDMGSSGLLLVTNDGDLAERVAHPRHGVVKTYRLTVRGDVSKTTIERALLGVRVDGERLRLSRARVIKRIPAASRQARPKTVLLVELKQGRYREIRRLFLTLGHPVNKLHRERIGILTDRDLRLGECRHLTPREISQLQRGRARPEPVAADRRRK